jgi:phosphohistidine phosphatase
MTKFAQIVVLVRHAQAVSTQEDPARPLSAEGRRQAQTMADWLAELDIEVEEIRHSAKARARETARHIAGRLSIGPAAVREVGGLDPSDEVDSVALDLEAARRSLMLVGHLPFMARLASRMLVGNPAYLNVRFAEAGVVILARAGGGWQLIAVLAHEMHP